MDKTTGKIYVANNEDYWYDVKSYIQIIPGSKNKLARLWYGWDDFAQGGVNEAGLFFDGAATPEQNIPEGYNDPNGRNVGDEILAHCSNVEEAIAYLEKEKIAASKGHIMFGDSAGNAAVLEWINGEKKLVKLENNVLIATNYLLSMKSAGNLPCYRFQSIEDRVIKLNESKGTVDLRLFGNVIAGAVQIPRKDSSGRVFGTLYSTFINISDMEFVLVYQLDNSNITRLNLKEEFAKTKKRRIKLKANS
ncbi:MAG: carcinine hydrolase/isopenicillin-N N-acyltransferase family protein [Bacteroidales bacterium]|nr:carcinine hydrolase/isopenicillin-N N-acyltransferase family protein [Bacteroidales bacterium]